MGKDWKFGTNIQLFDENYQLVDGFPEEGRSFFADLRMRL